MSNVVGLESWLDKKALAKHLGCGVRFIEYRIEQGMPHAVIAGRCKFRASEVERWLQEHGDMQVRGDTAA